MLRILLSNTMESKATKPRCLNAKKHEVKKLKEHHFQYCTQQKRDERKAMRHGDIAKKLHRNFEVSKIKKGENYP